MDEQDKLKQEADTQEKRQFGNYDLIRRIDMGGMGEVYLAHQRTAFDREVAIKIIRDDLSGDAVARARFFREAEVSAHLKHDHILPLFEFGEADGRLFLVTPYIPGGTLAHRLLAGPMLIEEARQLFSALAQAVAYIHRRGIVHRDLKPSNILLDTDEDSEQVYVRLIDFGIATKQGAQAAPPLTTAGQEIGTVAYMAPERLNGIAAPSNDIYSLGVILYQMLTRHLPGGTNVATDSLAQPLEAVVLRCLAINLDDRYASATEVLRAFEQACQALDAPDISASPDAIQPMASPLIAATQPANVERISNMGMARRSGDVPAVWKEGVFSAEDYIAPTTNVSADRKRRSRTGRRKPLVLALTLMMIGVAGAIAGVAYFALPLTASARVNIGPQVHALQQVFTITAQPSQTSIDVATTSVPVRQQIASLTGSLTGQTSDPFCGFFFDQCRQVVTSDDVEMLAAQLRQSLTVQLSTNLDNQLQALHDPEIGSKQYTDLAESSNPSIGSESSTVTVTLTEQGSVGYIALTDVQQLSHQLLAAQSGPHMALINSTVQIGQPVIEGIDDAGTVTMKLAAAGIAEYQWPSSQLEGILSHIEGMSAADAQTYIREQTGVDVNSVSISVHTLLGIGDTLPYNAAQITLIFSNPTKLPAAALPAVPTPASTPDTSAI